MEKFLTCNSNSECECHFHRAFIAWPEAREEF